MIYVWDDDIFWIEKLCPSSYTYLRGGCANFIVFRHFFFSLIINNATMSDISLMFGNSFIDNELYSYASRLLLWPMPDRLLLWPMSHLWCSTGTYAVRFDDWCRRTFPPTEFLRQTGLRFWKISSTHLWHVSICFNIRHIHWNATLVRMIFEFIFQPALQKQTLFAATHFESDPAVLPLPLKW